MVTPGKNGKKKPKGRRRIDIVDLLMTVIIFLILFLVLTVALIVIYPGAARNAADNILSPQSRTGKSLSKIGDRARDGITFRFAPLAKGFSSVFLKKSSKKEEKPVQVVAIKIDANECLKCHPAIFDQEAFNHIFVNHRQHAAANIPCQSCHSSTKHPRPATIKESGCRGCHKKLGATDECKACHTPGSVLDERVIPKETLNTFYAGRTSSKAVLVPVGFEHPVGDKKAACMQCHEKEKFCDSCHNSQTNDIISTPHKGNLIPTHGPMIFRNELSTTVCMPCHNNLFCAGACHSNPNKQRVNPGWPLPRLELKE